MTDKKGFRVFATSRIGDPAENRLRKRGYELEVFQGPEAPPKKLIIEKVKRGIDALITTLRDPIDARAATTSLQCLRGFASSILRQRLHSRTAILSVGYDGFN
jgi:hypothetical protein